jgi:NAD(P)-dependent dehydrogenase (short-subunit alcohol dehydrogenase family)
MEPRTALVTGSGRGIGLAIAERLTAVGYSVIGVDVAPDSPAGTLRYDLSSWDACHELVAAISDVDVLVNNAAVLIEKTADDITEDDFQTMIGVNLRAPFVLTREYARSMAGKGRGRVINISSVSARTGGFAATGVYAASKAGLIALTKYFARLHAPDGVTVNAIAPGAIDAPMAQAQVERDPRLVDEIPKLVPAGRWGRPDEVANVVAFLAGDDAAFINGVTVDINGGWVMT